MKIVHSLEEIDTKKPLVIAIGFFDGIHKGHQEIIKQAKEMAKNKSAQVGIITFYPHPLSIIYPHKPIKLLLSQIEKYKILSKYNIDIVIEINSNLEFLHQDYKQFLIKLQSIRNLTGIVVGENFTFGYKALGTPDLMKAFFDGIIDTNKVELIKSEKLKKTTVSSTLIRNFIMNGEVKEANQMLGRPYFIADEVVHGFKRGSELLGFPTANLRYDNNRVLPKDGVYATFVKIAGKRYKSITNVGKKPTFDDKNRTIETFIFDFDSKIYGETIILEWIEKIREEIKFKNFQELSLQIKKDIEKAKKLLINIK